ncbi:MAG TPA: PQQ-dependent sugar dehydrogenase [Planctomycetota bacterium]
MLRPFACLALAAALSLRPPSVPVFLEPSATGVHPADVHMHVEATYSDTEGDAHASTSWEIWKVSTGEKVWEAPASSGIELVHVHFGDGTFTGAYAGRTALEFDTDYRLEVRFRDATGQQGPPGSRAFRTSPAGPPGVDAPLPWIPAEAGYRVEVVAGGFQLPVNIAFHPNPGPAPTDPYFYVSELYGTIKVARRNGTVSTYASGLLNYDPTILGSFPGAGEQGLTGLCVQPDPPYDLFATMLYQFDAATRYPKVARLHGDGLTMATNTTVLDMAGESQGQSHQISNCTIGPDGKLYVHMGDGFTAATALDLNSFRGKILRMNLDGTAPTDNPLHNGAPINARDYVYAYGLRNPFGGAWRASDATHYKVENGNGVDRLARVPAGRNFNWAGSDATMDDFAIYNWTPSKAPVNLAFVQPETFFGSLFPAAKMGRAYVTESGPTYATGPQTLGKRIVEFALATLDNAATPTTFVEYAGTGQATAVGLAAGPDGLYFTDLYKDQGAASPAEAGARVLRVRYVGVPANGTGTGFEGAYFDNADFTGATATRTDAAVDFSWAGPPIVGLGGDDFSVRWLGRLEPRTSDTFTFHARTAGGVRLWVNGTPVIDEWAYHASTEHAGTIALEAGRLVDVVMEFRDDAGVAEARLRWSGPAQPKEAVPASQVYAPDARDNDGDGLVNTRDFDDDGDGTPDHVDADLDGDGHANAAEVAAGTDPGDKTSFPPAAPGSGGGGGCGLTGLEVFLLLYLIGIWKAN